MNRRIWSVCLSVALLLSMVAVTGVFSAAASTITATELGERDSDKLIAPADNILAKATVAVTDKTGTTAANRDRWNKVMYDGQVVGVNCTNDSSNVCVVGGARVDAFSSMYFAFTFDQPYTFESLLLGGYNDPAYGFINPKIYIGNFTLEKLIATDMEPAWSYDGVVKAGLKIDLSGADLTGRTLIIRSDAKGNGKYYFVHASEVAATGVEAPLTSTTELGEGDGDKLIAPADNILKNATAAVTDKTGTTAANRSNWNVLFDGQVAGVNCTNDNANIAVINGARWAEGQPFSSMYFSFELDGCYAVEKLLLGGYNDSSYGFINPQVYIGDESVSELIENQTQPVWSYTGVVKAGVLVDVSNAQPTGKYVIIRSDTKGSGQATYVHASELAATGTVVQDPTAITFRELGEGDSDKLIAPADNILKNATAAVTDKTGTTAANRSNWNVLFDGQVAGVNCTNDNANIAVINGARWAEGQPFSSMYLSFTLDQPYQIQKLLLGGYNDDSYGLINPQIYIGNASISEVIADQTEPVWSYSGVVKAGVLVDVSGKELVGTTVIIRSDTKGSGQATYIHASELAATGVPYSSKPEKETIVCVGDSITYGTVFPNKDNWSTRQLENNWPKQLQTLLNAASETVDYTVVNAGISGSAVIGASEGYPASNSSGGPTHWLTEQASSGFVRSADKVLIMLGTNDAHSSCWSARAKDYKTYYKKIIAAFREKNPNVQIYILTSPYTDVATHASGLADGVIPQQKELAKELGLPLIDVYGATKQFVADNGGNLSSFIDAVDIAKGLCVHPHEAGHTVIAKKVFDGLNGDTGEVSSLRGVKLGKNDADKLIAPGDNVLKKASPIKTDLTGKASSWVHANNWAALFDGLARGVNSDDCTVAAIGGEKASAEGYDYTKQYIVFDMGTEYNFTSFLLAGDNNATYGVQSLELFVGNEPIAQLIENNTAPQFSYMSCIEAGYRVTLGDEGLSGRYLTIRIGSRSNGKYWQCWLSELAAEGTLLDAPDAVTLTEIGEDQGDLLIQPRDNILAKKDVRFTDATGKAGIEVTEEYQGFFSDGLARGINSNSCGVAVFGGLQQNDSGYNFRTLYACFDLGQETTIRSFLFAGQGDGIYGAEHLAVYIGNESLETVIDGSVEPQWSYDNKVASGIVVDFGSAGRTGRYLIVRIGARHNSVYFQTWISELSASGSRSPAAVLTEPVENGEQIIAPADNLLRGADTAFTDGTGTAAISVSAAELGYLTDGLLRGVNSTDCGVLTVGGAKTNSDGYQYRTVYATFDMKKQYTVKSFLFAGQGDGKTSAENVALFVGDRTAQQIIADGAKPQWHTTDPIVGAKRVSLGAGFVGRYVVVRFTACLSGDDYRIWLSELAAAGVEKLSEEPVQTEFTADCSRGKVTMAIKQLKKTDRDFFLQIDHLTVTEERLPAGIDRNIESNWLSADGDTVYHLRLYDSAGNQIQSDGKERDVLVIFHFTESYSQAVGLLKDGTIRRIYNANTRTDGTIHAGSLTYPEYDSPYPDNRSKATLQDIDLSLVLLKYNDADTINALNGTVVYPSVLEFGKTNVAGAETAWMDPRAWGALAAALLLAGAGVCAVIRYRRRAAARGDQ